MHPKEAAKHNARRQVLKVLEHLRETRQKLTLVYDHLYLIKGANVPDCEAQCVLFAAYIDLLYEQLTKVFNEGVDLSHTLLELMENPNEKPPPIVGHFLAYTDRTPLQRALIREGYEEIAENSREHCPSHYYDQPAPDKPPTIIEPLPREKKKIRPKRSDMPL